MDRNYLLIGRLIKPFGLKGEIKADFYVDNISELDSFSLFYIKDPVITGKYKEISLENIRTRNGESIVSVKGCIDRNQSELLKGIDLFVDELELPKLKKDVYYIKDLLDMDAFYHDEAIGKVNNLFEIANKTMMVVRLSKGRDIVVPFGSQYVLSVDLNEKRLNLKSLDDLL